MENSPAQLMVMKAALMETTSTHGWQYIERFAEAVCRDLENQALAEEDDAKANGLRRNAKGAREFLVNLSLRISMAKQLNEEPTTDDFLELCM